MKQKKNELNEMTYHFGLHERKNNNKEMYMQHMNKKKRKITPTK